MEAAAFLLKIFVSAVEKGHVICTVKPSRTAVNFHLTPLHALALFLSRYPVDDDVEEKTRHNAALLDCFI